MQHPESTCKGGILFGAPMLDWGIAEARKGRKATFCNPQVMLEIPGTCTRNRIHTSVSLPRDCLDCVLEIIIITCVHQCRKIGSRDPWSPASGGHKRLQPKHLCTLQKLR